ncbi:MAG: AMP nucleosidase [Acidimicrobiales bacterium]
MSKLTVEGEPNRVGELVDAMATEWAAGWYPRVEVGRPWSTHNPQIDGEFANPDAIRPYLCRELGSLLERGACITVDAARRAVPFDDPDLFAAVDEGGRDLRAKKLFLFGPERMHLSMDRLSHYTGTPPAAFQRHVLFTNYRMHVDAFLDRFPDAQRPDRDGVQMPAYHHPGPDGRGVSLVEIGVGPANAKTITDHLAVLRPDAMIMIGHCGGLRNHQALGDFVLATSYVRADHVMDEVLPLTVPVIPTQRLNRFLLAELEDRDVVFRMGAVYTTDNRNWEFDQAEAVRSMDLARCVAVDMESATIAANGFRYRIPNATLLGVSDKPRHAAPKLQGAAREFYESSKRQHLDIALGALEQVSVTHPDGIPNADIRSSDEPLLGGPSD